MSGLPRCGNSAVGGGLRETCRYATPYVPRLAAVATWAADSSTGEAFLASTRYSLPAVSASNARLRRPKPKITRVSRRAPGKGEWVRLVNGGGQSPRAWRALQCAGASLLTRSQAGDLQSTNGGGVSGPQLPRSESRTRRIAPLARTFGARPCSVSADRAPPSFDAACAGRSPPSFDAARAGPLATSQNRGRKSGFHNDARWKQSGNNRR